MRSPGQLTDNVTESRLLQSRIMEMSRDRYKYIAQANFNKKFFINGQQRKTRLMPELLTSVDIDYWMSSKTTRHVPTFSSGSKNPRLALLDRLGKHGEKCKDFDNEEDNPFAMPTRPVKPVDNKQIPEFYRIILKEQEEAELAKTTFPTQPMIRPQTQVAFCKSPKKDVKLPEVVKSAKHSVPPRQKSVPPPGTPDRRSRARRVQSSNAAVKRVVQDPRYRTLESCLSAKYSRPDEMDPERVQSIISSQDSLHTPSKHALNARPKVQKTILEYLRARGFDV